MAKPLPKQSAATRNPATPQQRQEVITWARAEVARGRAFVPDKPLTSDQLARPGELEKALRQIRQRFVQADQRHRTALDHQVMQCFRVARFLYGLTRGPRAFPPGKWLEHWRKHKQIKTESLRYVFLQTHDSKKASAYFRATRKMFDEDVPIDEIPARVTLGGGYQALADANVRFPRKKPVEEEGDAEKPKRKPKPKASGSGSTESEGEADLEVPVPVDSDEPAETEDEPEASEPKLTLLATFEGDGISFLDLPMPFDATVIMHVNKGPGGSRTVRISHVRKHRG